MANILLDPRYGGPQHRVLQVADTLKNSEIQQWVVIPRSNSDFLHRQLLGRGIDVARLPLHRPAKRADRFMVGVVLFWPEVITLAIWLRRRKIQVVHCNSAWQVHGIVAGKFAGAKVILHLNDTWSPRWLRLIFWIVSPMCDGFIVAGARVREVYFPEGLRSSGGKPIFEIPAPVDPAVFDPDRFGAELDRPAERGFSVTTVCSINWMKGLEDFIEMAAILNEGDHGRLTFSVVGPLPDSQAAYMEKLQAQIRKRGVSNIEFPGMSGDVPVVLKQTDVYVCSSVLEASPMAVWEAMAMRLPVVSTDVGDVGRYVKSGESGQMVPVNDPEALADAVSTILLDSGLRRSMGERARETVLRSLTVQRCAEKHAEAYGAVAGTN